MTSISIVLKKIDGQMYAPADAVRSLIQDYERAHAGLNNCLLLAAKHRCESGDWQHIIRFCREAGVRPDILRASDSASVMHASDCAVHNEPALPVGPCNCGAAP